MLLPVGGVTSESRATANRPPNKQSRIEVQGRGTEPRCLKLKERSWTASTDERSWHWDSQLPVNGLPLPRAGIDLLPPT